MVDVFAVQNFNCGFELIAVLPFYRVMPNGSHV